VFWRIPRGTVALALALWTSGCATYSERTDMARSALSEAKYDESLEQFNKILEVKDSKALPEDWKHNAALVVLERATVLQAKGDYALSSRSFEAADKQLELLDLARDGAGKVGQYVFSDSATKFKTSPTEKLALNAMNMCNYLARGQLDGAKIEAKRFTVMRNYFRDYDPEHEHGAFGSYLAGFVYERLGMGSEALRYYDEALQERDFETLKPVIPRVAAKASYRTPRISAYITGDTAHAAPSPANGAELLVIVKVGRVPFKLPNRIPIGAAIGLAGAFITGDLRVLEHTMFKVVVYPELYDSGSRFNQAQVAIDGDEVSVDLATDLAAEITTEYEEAKPKIIGAAISRMIVRALAAEGARAAGRQAEGSGQLVGFLAAAVVEGTMVALDKPDTRSWSTLPAAVHIARGTFAPGPHHVEVQVSGPGGAERHRVEVDLPPGGFAVVDVTTLR